MKLLNTQTCQPCHHHSRKVTYGEKIQFINQLPKWKMIAPDHVLMLQRDFKFTDFDQALQFCNEVAHLAITEDHHPTLTLEWGKCTVTWWTHKVKGLHKNDFICAAKTDLLYENYKKN